jgi:hypothetical protein
MISMFELLAAATPAVESDGVVGDITKTFKVYWPLFISKCISKWSCKCSNSNSTINTSTNDISPSTTIK